MLKTTLTFLTLALLLASSYGEDASPVKLKRLNDATVSVEGTNYKALVAGNNASVDFEIRSSRGFVPAISNCTLIGWGDGWKRLFDNNSAGTKCSTVEKDDKVITTISGKSEYFDIKAEYTFTAEKVDVACTMKCIKDLDKLRRLSLEIDPVWDAAIGAGLRVEQKDASQNAIVLPSSGTANGKYETISKGSYKRINVENLHGIKGAGFEVAGDTIASLEQTGALFRWQLGIPEETNDIKVENGRIFSLNLSLSFSPFVDNGVKSESASVSIDTQSQGNTISPYIFGAQMANIGHGVKGRNMRTEYDYNPKHDEQARQLLKDSGITFVRIYLHSLYDSYVDKDPICPSEDAVCDYTRGDSYMEAMNELGIEVVPCVGLYCPPWLSTKRPSDKYNGMWMIHRAPPKDNQKWAAIIAGLVKHFNVEKKFNVKMWQVGNEPNDSVRYWIKGTLPEFIEYFKTASKAMKEADPSIKISGPDLSNLYAKAWPEEKVSWKDEFVKEAQDYFDDFSFNSYAKLEYGKLVKDARETLSQYSKTKKSIWLAEYNIAAGEDNLGLYDFRGALFVARSMNRFIESGLERASFYGFWASSIGMLDIVDGKLAPRPMYNAFRMYAALGHLKNGTMLKSSGAGKDIEIMSCRHDDGNGYSVSVISDKFFVEKTSLEIEMKDVTGDFTVKQYVLVPEKQIEELPAKECSLDKPFKVDVPGRSITMLVFRRK